jgi:type II secretory ATPase GspE/PulE/Tfp pilus assembly ATPase PilB-like protein
MDTIMNDAGDLVRKKILALDPKNARYAVELVDLTLIEARHAGASDIHLQPTADGLSMKWRIDGVLLDIATLPLAVSPNIVSRLKVMAELLTYKSDIPQEGRVRGTSGEGELRVSTFPSLFGEKAVVRLFAATSRFLRLADLGLPDEVRDTLRGLLDETSGAIILTGPAGSGKTTTIYACLRDLVESTGGRRSLATLEDPIEGAVAGVSQSQVNTASGFDLTMGLRSLLRQDPEVIVVGEVRDRATAEIAFQASLTGHLVLTTFHAGSSAGALGRLADMGIEPYLLRSGILAIVSQRLVRTLCDCAVWSDDTRGALGIAVDRYRIPKGCAACRGVGYRGRLLLAELLAPEPLGLGQAVLARSDVRHLEAQAVEAGMIGLWQRARTAIADGKTSPAEIRRVFGFFDHRLDNL